MTRIRRNLIRALLPKFEEELSNLLNEGLVSTHDHHFSLTDKGIAIAAEEHLSPYVSPVCDACHGKTILLKGPYENWSKQFQEITKDRPKAIKDYETLIHRFGDLENKDILIVGDDDLTSLAKRLVKRLRAWALRT